MLAALDRPRSRSLAELVQENYSWAAAARATREAYDEVLRLRRELRFAE